MLTYVSDVLSPLTIQWKAIEGFWPGFQLREQEAIVGNTALTPDNVAITLRPQSVEIEERTNWVWRLYNTIPMSSIVGLPFFDEGGLKIWLHFLRIHGTFEIALQSHSPVFAHDFLINMLARWNTRYSPVGTLEYPVLVPIRLIEDVKPPWRDILLNSPRLHHAYLGVTGEEHYYFMLSYKPLVKLSGAPSYSVAGEQLSEASFQFEYLTSIPVAMVWSDVGPVEHIYYLLKYDQTATLPLLAATLALNLPISFRPIGWAQLTTTPATLLLWVPTSELAFALWDATTKTPLDATITTKTSDTYPSRLEVTIEIQTPGYDDLTNKTVLLFWGPK
jgi:hypothetical protein